MSGIERPTTFEDAMVAAREFTLVTGKALDERTDLDIYSDVSRLLVQRRISPTLNNVPISDERKQEVVEAETCDSAQLAYQRDSEVSEPTELMSMLEELGAFGFNCLKHCVRRKALIKESGVVFHKHVKEEGLKVNFGPMVFMQGDLDEIMQTVVAGDSPDTFKAVYDGGMLECKVSPDCQEACPVPDVASKRFKQAVEVTAEGMIVKGGGRR